MNSTHISLYEAASQTQAIQQIATQMLPIVQSQSTAKTIVLTGGNTCRALYSTLAQQCTDWSHLTILPSDERYVKTDDERSNAGMIESLLPETATVVNLAGSTTEPVEQRTEQLNQMKWDQHFPVEFSLLGLGPDGHIASLFPDVSGLAAAMDTKNAQPFFSCQPASQDTARISLTFSHLLKSKKIFLLTSGEPRLTLIKNALSTDSQNLPIDSLLQQTQTPVEIYWYP